MSDKKETDGGVHIEVHTDKRGKDHVSVYDRDPEDKEHKTIHVNIDTENEKGRIIDTTSGEKEVTDVNCFITSACMKNFHESFDDNCEELVILRWFRDNFVSDEDKKYYCEVSPIIVETINNDPQKTSIYQYIYENVIQVCVKLIKKGDYDLAYDRYKNMVSILSEQSIAREHGISKRYVKKKFRT